MRPRAPSGGRQWGWRRASLAWAGRRLGAERAPSRSVINAAPPRRPTGDRPTHDDDDDLLGGEPKADAPDEGSKTRGRPRISGSPTAVRIGLFALKGRPLILVAGTMPIAVVCRGCGSRAETFSSPPGLLLPEVRRRGATICSRLCALRCHLTRSPIALPRRGTMAIGRHLPKPEH